ncbi:L-ascorbate oxidase, putative [Rhizoctonia solani AG-1 IA]|uniref:L-ascorbate oxidase, putative n=1 Tax=Thanatephorus cucumeris (strain AG1-IA) TaxID=983506 RepID=L8WJ63_THACA|nr:L-ascorbate oxidase, putative [Rhizoctonia solani AG-1 IA]
MQLRNVPLFLGAILPVAQAALRLHTLNLTYGTNNADGTTREAWLINGQTPGPHLVWDEGDDVSVKVLNNGHEPVTIHWHGLEQVGTPWSDGVPGMTQWPIPPGGDFKMQLDDGLKGTLYIRPNPNKPKPFNQISNSTSTLKNTGWPNGSVPMLNNFALIIYSVANGKGPVKCPNMTEINAIAAPEQKPLTKKGNKIMFPYPESRPEMVEPSMWYNCTNSNTTFEVFTVKKSNGWAHRYYRTAEPFGIFVFPSTRTRCTSVGYRPGGLHSSTNHPLLVAADGHYTKVQVATSILIPIGERYQFFVKLDQPVGDYVIRTAAVVLPQLISGYAILSYVNSGKTGAGVVEKYALPAAKKPVSYIDYAGNIINGGVDLVQANLSPFPASPPPQAKFYYQLHRDNSFSIPIGNSWHEPKDDFTPLLFQPGQIASLDPTVYFSYPNGTLVDLIFTVTAGNPAMHPPHPMHKHGVKAWFLGSGDGPFPYASVKEAVDAGYKGINLKNPPLRDDFVTPVAMTGQAWAAVRFRAVDPGPIVLHCHIDAHLATGMVIGTFQVISGGRGDKCSPPSYIALLEGPEKLTGDCVPSYYLTKNKS